MSVLFCINIAAYTVICKHSNNKPDLMAFCQLSYNAEDCTFLTASNVCSKHTFENSSSYDVN